MIIRSFEALADLAIRFKKIFLAYSTFRTADIKNENGSLSYSTTTDGLSNTTTIKSTDITLTDGTNNKSLKITPTKLESSDKISINHGFDYKGTNFNFSRDYYNRYVDLLKDTEKYDFPTNFLTIVGDGFEFEYEDPNDFTGPFLVSRNNESASAPWKLVGDLAALGKIGWNTSSLSGSFQLVAYADINLKNNKLSNVGKIETAVVYTASIVGGALINKTDTTVWNTNGGVVDLTAYAKLADANFTSLKVSGNTVATQTWTNTQIASAVSQALKYKGGIAKQADITTAETNLAVGYVYVCTVAGNYTINGGTTYLEIGDTLICKDVTATIKWTVVQANITGAVTKQTDLVANQLVLGNNASSVKPLAAGTNGTILKIVSGVPTWAAEYSYSLPLASASDRGGITLGYTNSGKNYAIQVDTNGKAFVNVPWVNTTYGVFSTSANGLVPKPDETTKSGAFLKVDGTWAVPTDTKYTLPAATTSALGGIKLGSTYSGQDPDTSSYFYLQKDASNVGYVDLSHEKLTDTTYSISVSDATITLTGSDDSSKSITVNNVANATKAESASYALRSQYVGNPLVFNQLTDSGTSSMASYFDGSSPTTIDAISYTEIDALFK